MQLDQGIFLAAFGGGVAAGVVILGIEMIRRYWERPLVKVTVGVGLSMSDDPESRDAQLVLEAANVHGQPVTLVSCGLILSTGHRVVLPRSQMSEFPVELGLQRPVVKTVSVEQLLNRLEVWSCVPEDVRFAYFTSSTGRVFKTRLSRDIVAALSRGCDMLAVSFDERTYARQGEMSETPPELAGGRHTDSPLLSWSAFRRLTRR
ncbi:MAG: hypothetical protein JXA58_06325 [Dehalococcoidia bacterium]|nr:hypothetical protein [Dehalococcoidia bacterium]